MFVYSSQLKMNKLVLNIIKCTIKQRPFVSKYIILLYNSNVREIVKKFPCVVSRSAFKITKTMLRVTLNRAIEQETHRSREICYVINIVGRGNDRAKDK